MATQQVTQGNMIKLVVALTENGTAYTALGTADIVKCRLEHKNKQTTLEIDSDDANVTLDDPLTGSVSWQLTSVQTDALALGVYDMAVQVEYGGNTKKLEWVELSAVEIVHDFIA